MASGGILTSLLQISLLLLAWCQGEVVRTECSGSTLNITCSKGVIVVRKVVYGQSEGCYYDSKRCTHEHSDPHPCSGAYFCHWKVPILDLPQCGPSHYVQITYDCFIDGMAGETWTNAVIPSDIAPPTTASSPRFTEPQASVQERAQYDYYEYDYDVNSTAEAMSDEVLLLTKKNSPEKWATITGGTIAGVAVILLMAIVIIMIIERQRSKPEIPEPDYDDVTINGNNQENGENDGYENVNLGFEGEDEKESPRYETITPPSQLMTQLPHIGETNTSDIDHLSTPNGSVYQNMPTPLPNIVQISRPATPRSPRSPIHSTMLRINYEDAGEPVLDWNSINSPITHLPNSIPHSMVHPGVHPGAHPADFQLKISTLQSLQPTMTIPANDYETDDVLIVDNDAYESNNVAL